MKIEMQSAHFRDPPPSRKDLKAIRDHTFSGHGCVEGKTIETPKRQGRAKAAKEKTD